MLVINNNNNTSMNNINSKLINILYYITMT